VVALSVAIAATFVSTAYEKVEGGSDDAGVALMIATLLLTIVIVAFAPSPPNGEVDGRALKRFRCWAHWAHWLMVLQVLTSSASVVAVILVKRPEWQTWFLPWHWT
jgi:hypothetical protein